MRLNAPRSESSEGDFLSRDLLEASREMAALLRRDVLVQRQSHRKEPSIGVGMTDRGERQKGNFGFNGRSPVGGFSDQHCQVRVEFSAGSGQHLAQFVTDSENVEQMKEAV